MSRVKKRKADDADEVPTPKKTKAAADKNEKTAEPAAAAEAAASAPLVGWKPTRARISISVQQKVDKAGQKFGKRDLSSFVGRIASVFAPRAKSVKLKVKSEIKSKALFAHNGVKPTTVSTHFEDIKLEKEGANELLAMAKAPETEPKPWNDMKWLTEVAHARQVCCQLGFVVVNADDDSDELYLGLDIYTVNRPIKCRCEFASAYPANTKSSASCTEQPPSY